jgi:hypothetical protein
MLEIIAIERDSAQEAGAQLHTHSTAAHPPTHTYSTQPVCQRFHEHITLPVGRSLLHADALVIVAFVML